MYQNIIDVVTLKSLRNPKNDEGDHVNDKKVIEEVEQNDAEVKKEESSLICLMEKARAIYIEKGLVGNVSITRSLTVFYRSISCDVDGVAEKLKMKSISASQPIVVDREPTTFEKFVGSLINRCIGSLERRARPYKKKPYKDNLILSNTVYYREPFIGLMSINVTCSATASSLNAAADAAELAAAVAAKAKMKKKSAKSKAQEGKSESKKIKTDSQKIKTDSKKIKSDVEKVKSEPKQVKTEPQVKTESEKVTEMQNVVMDRL